MYPYLLYVSVIFPFLPQNHSEQQHNSAYLRDKSRQAADQSIALRDDLLDCESLEEENEETLQKRPQASSTPSKTLSKPGRTRPAPSSPPQDQEQPSVRILPLILLARLVLLICSLTLFSFDLGLRRFFESMPQGRFLEGANGLAHRFLRKNTV